MKCTVLKYQPFAKYYKHRLQDYNKQLLNEWFLNKYSLLNGQIK